MRESAAGILTGKSPRWEATGVKGCLPFKLGLGLTSVSHRSSHRASEVPVNLPPLGRVPGPTPRCCSRMDWQSHPAVSSHEKEPKKSKSQSQKMEKNMTMADLRGGSQEGTPFDGCRGISDLPVIGATGPCMEIIHGCRELDKVSSLLPS